MACSSVALAQHDPSGVTGGGMIGGSTGRPASKPATKPATKPLIKPASTTTTTPAPRRRTTPTTPVTRPATTTTTSSNADYYYQQGEALYNSQKYREALDPYLKAAQINPSMASALYRVGWIYNDLEEYDSAVDPLREPSLSNLPTQPRSLS